MSAIQRPGIGVEGLVVAILDPSTDVIGGTPVYDTPLDLAGLAKLTVNPNGTVATDYADDGPSFVATTVGKIQIDLDMQDVVPSSIATIFGISYANGVLVDSSLDTSPYLALGYKQWLAGLDDSGDRVFRYVWLLKGVLAKPPLGGETKKDTLNYQHMTIKGEFAFLQASSARAYMTSVRTDDPNVLAATLTNFFDQPVLSGDADLSALTVVATTGAGGTGTFLLTFSKASASASLPFTISTAVIAAMTDTVEVIKVSDGSVVDVSYALLSAGTGLANSTVTVRGTTAAGNIAVYIAAGVESGLVDGSGVEVTEYHSGSVTLHA